jgi:hypothetical protein
MGYEDTPGRNSGLLAAYASLLGLQIPVQISSL